MSTPTPSGVPTQGLSRGDPVVASGGPVSLLAMACSVVWSTCSGALLTTEVTSSEMRDVRSISSLSPYVADPRLRKYSRYGAVAEAKTAEHGARLSAMQAAEQNIEDRIADLRVAYHQLRQAKITEEILDVVSGFEAFEDS
ncbi:MAG: F0F1 ATP synthase subunit gamma [Actinomycetota bacterium]